MLKAKTIYSKEYSITMISPAEQTGGPSINLIYILMPVMLQFLQQENKFFLRKQIFTLGLFTINNIISNYRA